MLNEFLKISEKCLLIKANIKQQEIKDLVAVSYIFFKKYPQNLKYNVKEGVFFN